MKLFIKFLHIPADDVAHFLVMFNPNLDEELAIAIEQRIFDKNEGKKYE